MGEQKFWGKFMGGVYVGTNDHMQGWNLMVNRFQRMSQVSSPLIDPDLAYYII